MKKLLSSISALILGGSALSSMATIEQTQMNSKHMVESVQYYWNDAHTDEIKYLRTDMEPDIPAPGEGHPKYQRTIYTFNLGVNKPTFNTLSFINSKGIGLAWGNRSYLIDPPILNLLFEDQNNIKLTNEDEAKIDQFTTTTAYDHKEYQGDPEGLHFYGYAITKMGNVWYKENNSYYLQFLLYQFAQEAPAWSMVANAVSLGDKMELN